MVLDDGSPQEAVLRISRYALSKIYSIIIFTPANLFVDVAEKKPQKKL